MSLQDILPYRLPNHVGKRLIDPHVVIVGAGASIAACEIDKNGKKVPLLKNIHNILGLTDELKKYNFSDEQMEDFEKLFSDINGKTEYRDLQKKLLYAVSHVEYIGRKLEAGSDMESRGLDYTWAYSRTEH